MAQSWPKINTRCSGIIVKRLSSLFRVNFVIYERAYSEESEREREREREGE